MSMLISATIVRGYLLRVRANIICIHVVLHVHV
jgi:hypothetical protein